MSSKSKHVVDFHTHAFPDKVADRAAEALSAAYGLRPVARPTPAGLTELMDQAGVDVSVILPVATRPEQVRSINDWAATVNSERLVCFGALHPDLPDPAAEVDRIVSLRLKGVKFQPQFQEFDPADERLWPCYEALQGRLDRGLSRRPGDRGGTARLRSPRRLGPGASELPPPHYGPEPLGWLPNA